MVSKLTKIVSAFALFGVLAMNSSYADGDYGMAAKKHNKKPKIVECEKPMMEQPCYEAAPMSMKKSGLGSGMTLGVGVDGGFAVNSNSDFVISAIQVPIAAFGPLNPAAAFATQAITFNQKRDTLYGAYASLGWMMSSGIEANAEIAYHQFKLKDKNNSKNSIESDIVSGMLNVNYYIDMFDGMFLPYVTVGAGIARDKSKGTLFDNTPLVAAGVAAGVQNGPNQVSFKDLTKTTFAYQAGAGIATSFDNVVLGVGYKFFGLASFSDSNTDLTASVVSQTGGNAVPVIVGNYALNNLNFGSMKKNTHNVTAFVKFAF